jgi:hypothetical protein
MGRQWNENNQWLQTLGVITLTILTSACTPGGSGSSLKDGANGLNMNLNVEANNAEADLAAANLIMAKFTNGTAGTAVSGYSPTLDIPASTVAFCTTSNSQGVSVCFLRSSVAGNQTVKVKNLPGGAVYNTDSVRVTFINPLPKPAYTTTSSHGIGISTGGSMTFLSLIGEPLDPVQLFVPSTTDRVITSGLVGTVIEQ